MNEMHLFAGAGGGILAGLLLGHTPVCAVEIEPYCQKVLRARQADRSLPKFPIYGDIKQFDATPWKGVVDIVAGGFPCTDISGANKNAVGITGKRSGLWTEFARVIEECKPRFVFIENGPMLRTRGLDVVLADLATMGFDAQWGCLSAAQVGANHKRDRIWILGHSNYKSGYEADSQTYTERSFREAWSDIGGEYWKRTPAPDWAIPEATSDRIPDGVAHRVDRLRAIGNGQVPAAAATAFRKLKERFEA